MQVATPAPRVASSRALPGWRYTGAYTIGPSRCYTGDTRRVRAYTHGVSGDGAQTSLSRRRSRLGLRYRRRSATGAAQTGRKMFGRAWGTISHDEAAKRKAGGR